MPAGLRIRLFNVRYSPNLGDGLLSECLERELLALGADPDIASIDLAARARYGEALPRRATIMRALDATPAALRPLALRLPLALLERRAWRPHYAAGLAGAQAVVVGGGNLFSDLDLNFPTKLRAAFREAGRRGLPVAVYGVGVTAGWSTAGAARLRQAVTAAPLAGVFVRDRPSKQNWDRTLGQATGRAAQVVRDPGLLAARHLAADRPPAGARRRIGIAVMSHLALRHHAGTAPDRGALDGWYAGLVEALLARGHEVILFTNGSPEDRLHLGHLRPGLPGPGTGVAVVQPEHPSALSATIAGLDGVVAHRMHTVIAAYSHRVPAVALAWDPKLEAFMESVGRTRHLLDLRRDGPQACADRLADAMAEGIDGEQHAAVLAEAADGVRQLHRCLEAARTVAPPDP